MKELLLLVVGLLSISLSAQSTIEGRVITAEDNPISFASVAILGSTRGASTADDGTYQITSVPSGTYTVKCSAIGYSSITKSVTITDATILQLDFTLSASNTELQTVEIIGRSESTYKNTSSFIGTKSANRLADVPQSISYVTKELALDQAAFRVNDVVKNISGVNQFSFYNDISIRGFRVSGQRSSGNLINGMRAFTSFWKQQLIPHIERVEVIKGPASALFGNASPGGLINRVTKKPLQEKRQSISSTIGSFSTFRLMGDFTGPLTEDESLLYRLNLGYENSGNFRDLQFDKNIVVAPSFSFLPTDKTRINFDIVYQGSEGRLDRGQAVFGDGDLFSVPISTALNAANDFLHEESLNVTLALQHQFTDRISFNSLFMRSSYAEDLLEHRTANTFATLADGSRDPQQVEMRVFIRKRNWANNNFNNYFNIDFDTGDITHQLLVGHDYFEQVLARGGSQLEARGYLLADGGATNRFDPASPERFILDAAGNPVPNVPHFDLTDPFANQIRDMSDYIYRTRQFPQSKLTSHGLYLQNQTTIGNLRLLVGIRREIYTDVLNYLSDNEEEVTQSVWIPRVGAVYTLNDNINLYGTYVEGFQPQSPSAINDPLAGGPFDPLTGKLIEFGTKTNWLEGRLSATVALFHLTQSGALYNANDPQNPDLLAQIGEEVSKGIEIDLAGRITPNLSIVASYSFNDATITVSDDESEIGRQKPNAPRHTGNVWMKYIITSGSLNGLGIGLGSNFVTERFGSIVRTPEPPLFPGYHLVDAAIFYRINKVQLQVNFGNVFNKTHWVGGYDFIRAFPGAPRNVMTTVSYTF